ncbi:hypothetical protein ACFCYB_00220 [Streptomyces sp. NPDC056309]|uniref:hypothetical protein n=1 Tax=Streptomyces sp. NPDC056309 TaxID=3345781 RepID=UPI0035DC5FB8
MAETKPGADELRIRSILRQRGVGPDAQPDATIPPMPTQRPRDWLDDILDSNPGPAREKPANERRAPGGAKGESEETKPDPETEQEPEEEKPDAPAEGQPPAWDPVAVADRIVRAYRDRPASTRLRDAADVAWKSKARLGQLVFTASGVWAAWRIGMTPWLLLHTADAPIGIPVAALGAGWLVNRRCDAGPLLIAWTGRAVYTATVINLVLHP